MNVQTYLVLMAVPSLLALLLFAILDSRLKRQRAEELDMARTCCDARDVLRERLRALEAKNVPGFSDEEPGVTGVTASTLAEPPYDLDIESIDVGPPKATSSDGGSS